MNIHSIYLPSFQTQGSLSSKKQTLASLYPSLQNTLAGRVTAESPQQLVYWKRESTAANHFKRGLSVVYYVALTVIGLLTPLFFNVFRESFHFAWSNYQVGIEPIASTVLNEARPQVIEEVLDRAQQADAASLPDATPPTIDGDEGDTASKEIDEAVTSAVTTVQSPKLSAVSGENGHRTHPQGLPAPSARKRGVVAGSRPGERISSAFIPSRRSSRKIAATFAKKMSGSIKNSSRKK